MTFEDQNSLRRGGAVAVRGVAARRPVKTLYIVGDSRCGSTLLQHLIALQEGVCAVGELRRLDRWVSEGRACACGRAVDQCRFWTSVAERLETPIRSLITGVNRGPWQSRIGKAVEIAASRLGSPVLTRALLRREGSVAGSCLAINRVVGELTGSHTIVDSSKCPSHFLHVYLADPDTVIPAFLVRDGRGIIWSKMRRSGIDVEEAIKRWLRGARMILAVRHLVPPAMREFVYYEEICRRPRETLERILGRIGVAVQSTRLAALPAERHDLGGSPRFRNGVSTEIKLDERWRTEMPVTARRTFDRLGRAMNERFGYE